jgi:hypothetical protein
MSGCYEYQNDYCNDWDYNDCHRPRRRHHRYNDCWSYNSCS